MFGGARTTGTHGSNEPPHIPTNNDGNGITSSNIEERKKRPCCVNKFLRHGRGQGAAHRTGWYVGGGWPLVPSREKYVLCHVDGAFHFTFQIPHIEYEQERKRGCQDNLPHRANCLSSSSTSTTQSPSLLLQSPCSLPLSLPHLLHAKYVIFFVCGSRGNFCFCFVS